MNSASDTRNPLKRVGVGAHAVARAVAHLGMRTPQGMRTPHSALRNSQSAIHNSQFTIRNSQSAIRNPQFAIMIIFPAIDLRHGRCVRLRQGDPNAEPPNEFGV
jgi:hypothetical protein